MSNAAKVTPQTSLENTNSDHASKTDAEVCHGHFVQFYRSDRFLVISLVEYIRLALVAGDGVVVLASKQHQVLVKNELKNVYPNFEQSAEYQQVLFLDAEVLLTNIMTDGHPDFGKFKALIGTILSRMRASSKAVRIYAEFANILSERQRMDEAIELEGYWNTFLKENSDVTLMCSCATNNLENGYEKSDLVRVSEVHSDMIPAERLVDDATDEELFQKVAKLELRSILLNINIEKIAKVSFDLREIKRALCRSGKLSLLGELCSSIAVEFNNPLTYINLRGSQLLNEAQNLPSQTGDCLVTGLQEIERAVQRMTKVVSALMTFSRKDSVSDRLFCVVDALEAAIEFVTKLSAKEEIQLVLKVSEEDHFCFGNREQIVQVFVNLITSAKDSICRSENNGSGLLEVIVRCNENSEIEVIFNDNGAGQAQETSTGLSVIQEIITDHRGHIHVSCSEGVGSQFKVLLPLFSEEMNQSVAN
jgi:nitrogen-specific signal transduction histidine kinase